MSIPSGSTRRQDAERARANASPEGTRAMDGPRNPTLSAKTEAAHGDFSFSVCL